MKDMKQKINKHRIPHIFFIPYKNDFIYKTASILTKGVPIYSALIYFFVSFGVIYMLGLLTGQYYGKNGLPPMYTQIIDNINLAFLAPIGAGLLCHLYKTIGNTFNAIKRDGLISKNEFDKYDRFLERADRYYNNLYAFIISFTFSFAMNTYNYLVKTESWLGINGGITGCYGRIFIIFNFTIIFLIIYKYFVTIWALQYILGNFNIKISPIHPDHSGGLKPIGALAIAANYFMALIVLYITLLIVFDPFARGAPVYFYAFIFFYPISIFSFFASLSKAHNKMKTKKNEVISNLGKTFDSYYEKLNSSKKNGVYDLREFELISHIETLYNIAIKMPVWPFDVNTMRRFFTSFSIPILVFLIDKLELINRITKPFQN